MLKIHKFELSPRVRLTCASTEKFKTAAITVNLITRLSKEDASKNALIPKVLRRGTATLPDLRALSNACDDLYGASIGGGVRRYGELQTICFSAQFVDDDVVPGDEKLLERTTALLGEMLLRPATRNGLLIGEYVESEKQNLIDELRAEINNKNSYANTSMLRSMCEGEAYGVNPSGDEKSVAEITAKSLTTQYKKLLDTARVEVVYVGAAAPESVRDAMTKALAGLPKTKADDIPPTEILFAPPTSEVRVFKEKLDVTQGKLSLGFRMGETMRNPNYAAIAVFSAAFGGSVTSKLFMNVREKLSLCYYASSSIDKHKGIMVVASGVEFANFELAYTEILKNLDAIRTGDLTDDEVLYAKRDVATRLLATLDSPSGLESACFDQMLAGIPYTPDEFATLAENVTREQIIEIANSVVLDSAYYMQNVEATENEN